MNGGRSLYLFIAATALAAVLLPASSSRPFNIRGSGPEVGVEAADFTLPDTSGNDIRLSDFKGSVILLSFWSCYTDKCFTSVRIIKDLLEEFHGRGLVAPTVCSEIPDALAKDNYAELLKRCGLGQVVMVDADRDIKRIYKVRRLPSSFLIGPDFTIREVAKGVARLREPGFRESLVTLLEQVTPAAVEGGE